MRSRTAFALALFGSLTLASVAHADSFRTEDPDAKKEYIAAIGKGEAAFVAKDVAGATTAFKDAIKLDTSRMLAFYRLGETELSQKKYDEGISTLQGALSKKGPNLLKAKILFLIATGNEWAHKLPAAKEGWNAYLTFINANSDAKGLPNIAAQHIKVIERRMKDEVDYAAVKDRIEKRKKEVEAEAAQNAKNDKLNK